MDNSQFDLDSLIKIAKADQKAAGMLVTLEALKQSNYEIWFRTLAQLRAIFDWEQKEKANDSPEIEILQEAIQPSIESIKGSQQGSFKIIYDRQITELRYPLPPQNPENKG